MIKLDKVLDEYRRGVLSEAQLQRELDMMAVLDETEENVAQARIAERVASVSFVTYSVTPEESVLESERQKDIMNFLGWTRKIVGDKNFSILCWYVIDRMTQETIANRLDISQQAVQQRLKGIKDKVDKYLVYYTKNAVYSVREDLLHQHSHDISGDVRSLGYPYEFLQRVNAGGHWHHRRDGRKVYMSREACLLPQYFEISFGNKDTVCPIGCRDCDKRRLMNDIVAEERKIDRGSS